MYPQHTAASPAGQVPIHLTSAEASRLHEYAEELRERMRARYLGMGMRPGIVDEVLALCRDDEAGQLERMTEVLS